MSYSSLRNRSTNNSRTSVHHPASTKKSQKLNTKSTAEDALVVFSQIKAELATQIDSLTRLKKNVIRSEQVDSGGKSRLRITIESLLIDLNEEIFALSEQVAKIYSADERKSRVLVNKAREFNERKK